MTIHDIRIIARSVLDPWDGISVSVTSDSDILKPPLVNISLFRSITNYGNVKETITLRQNLLGLTHDNQKQTIKKEVLDTVRRMKDCVRLGHRKGYRL